MSDIVLSHTKRNCKYHIKYLPCHRRQVFMQRKRAIGEILRRLCDQNKYYRGGMLS